MQQKADVNWYEIAWCLTRGGFTLDEYIRYKKRSGNPLSCNTRQGLHLALCKRLRAKKLYEVRTAEWHARRAGLVRYCHRRNLLADLRKYGGSWNLAMHLAGAINFDAKINTPDGPQCPVKPLRCGALNYYLWLNKQLFRFSGIFRRSGIKSN